MRENTLTLEPLPKRHPRRMLVVWTHGEPDSVICKRILTDIKPFFENILEVSVPSRTVVKQGRKVEESVAPGYIYIKVRDPDANLYDAIGRVKGVGGFIGKDWKESLLGIPLSDVRKMREMEDTAEKLATDFQVGDLILVKSGLLEGAKGRVVEVTDKVKAEVVILGRHVPHLFLREEVKIIESVR